MIAAVNALRTILSVVMACSLWQNVALAQDQGSRSLGPVLLAVGQGIEEARVQKLPVKAELDQLQDRLLALEQELNKRRSAVPEDYQVTFNAYRREVLAVLPELGSPAAAKAFAAISADLDIKIRYLADSAGFLGTRAPPLIVVTVQTLRSGVPAPGYRVSFNSVGNGHGTAPTHPVSSDTNNAVRNLPPGRYTLQLYWAGKLVESRDADIGSVSSKEETISIDVATFAN
jgi:hypothetical protein